MKNNIFTKRFNAQKLNIGTYYLAPYARTETHVKDMAECGIDFVINIPNDRSLLALLSRYHIGAIVTQIFPGWFGGDGSNAGMLECKNPIEAYESALQTFLDSPNILGIDTGDEPSALDFKHYGRIFDVVQNTVPHLQPYLNIYPSYAVKGSNTLEEVLKQHQTANYEAYIEAYCKNVASDYLCFDYYLYSASLDGLYETFEIVSTACKKYHRDMWVVLQVNSHEQDKWISLQQLRYQAFTAMAFGAKTITWACYTGGWWYNHVLDKEGNQTEQYKKLQKVNAEIHFLGDEYMRYDYVDTYFIGNHPVSSILSANTLHTDFVTDLKATHDEALFVSVMQKESTNALFICAANDCYDEGKEALLLSFRTLDHDVILFKNETRTVLTPDSDNCYTFSIYPNEGALLTFLPSKEQKCATHTPVIQIII